MTPQALGHLLHRLQLARHGTDAPRVKEFLSTRRTHVVPELLEQLAEKVSPANQSSRDGSVHDRLHRIPRKLEHGCCGIDGAAGLKNLDSKGFKEKGESGMLRRPRWYDRLHPMLGTPAAGKTSDNLRDVLHGVEMPPPSLFGVIS